MSTTTVEINGEQMTLVETVSGIDRYEDEHGDDRYFTAGSEDEIEVFYCEDCEEIGNADDAEAVAGDRYVCASCLNNYSECAHCETLHFSDDMTWTLSDEKICDHCRAWNYSYCDYCDGYYNPEWDDDHYHDGCDCEAPAQKFRIRNGEGFLANDERLEISLPAGVISDEGIGAMARAIQRHVVANVPHVAYDYSKTNAENAAAQAGNATRQNWMRLSHTLSDIGQEWQTKQGNFTKRLSRHAYKTYGIEIPADLLSQIGNLGSQHSQGRDVAIEVTRNLNLPAEDFAHEDSCWWQSYSSSRCALKNHGGFGLRTFTSNGWGEYVDGRAWVMPMRETANGSLTPTFDAENASAFVVFNGYGDLDGYTPTRIMAGLYGWTYRKISFSCDPMYVNGEQGHLVAPEEIAKRYDTNGSIHLSVYEHDDLYAREQHAALVSA